MRSHKSSMVRSLALRKQSFELGEHHLNHWAHPPGRRLFLSDPDETFLVARGDSVDTPIPISNRAVASRCPGIEKGRPR